MQPPAAAGGERGDGRFGRCGRRRRRHRRAHRDPGLRAVSAALAVQLHRSPGRLHVRRSGPAHLRSARAPTTRTRPRARVLPAETRRLPELGAEAEHRVLPRARRAPRQLQRQRRGTSSSAGFADGVGSTLDGDYSRRSAIDSNITTGEQRERHDRVPDHPEVHAARGPDGHQPDRRGRLEAPEQHRHAERPGRRHVRRDRQRPAGTTASPANGQYGFQSAQTLRGDALTGGPYNVWIENNEISYNDTCDLSGPAQQRRARLEEPQPCARRVPRPALRHGQGRRQPGRLQALGHQRRDDQEELDPPQLGRRRLGRHQQRQHHVDRQHDHGQRERGDLGGDLLQLLDHRQLHRPEQPDRRAEQPRLPHAGHLRLGVRAATPRTAASPRAACRRASRPACQATRDRSVIAGQHPRGQRRRGVPVAELQPPLRRRVRRGLHPDQGAARRGRSARSGCAANLPGRHARQRTYLGQGHRIPARELLGRLHVADAERARHAAT